MSEFFINLFYNEVTFVIVGAVIILYKVFMKERIFRNKVNNKKIIEFIEFVKDKKNLKNNLAVENMFMYRFNFYIKYSILKQLIKLKNPTYVIDLYINSFNLLDFDKKILCFNNGFLLSNEKKRVWRYYLLFGVAISSFIVSFLSFVYGIGILFSQVDYASGVFVSLVYGLSFLFGFLIMTGDAVRIKDAEKLIKIFNENSLRDD